jgi:hypothetical protein
MSELGIIAVSFGAAAVLLILVPWIAKEIGRSLK